MLNIIGTIDQPTKGRVMVAGTRITDRTSDSVLADLRLNKIGFVFQTFNLLPTMTAIENVELPMVLQGRLSASQRRARAKELLERVGLGHRLTHYPSQLSGGEQQRVTIARAIANRPEILLLDEPTGDLDTKNTKIVMQLLTDLNIRDNITCVMVTHDVGLKNYASKVVQMVDGKIQSVRHVPPAVRESMQLADQGFPAGVPTHSGAMNLRDCTITELRNPSDYATVNGLGGSSNDPSNNDFKEEAGFLNELEQLTSHLSTSNVRDLSTSNVRGSSSDTPIRGSPVTLSIDSDRR
mmetsp:Transcript_42970/g.69728  ORF Transcript_42970/g.69728 Transcript_42970/m.69728 type:complete len:295 (-) Transcript_42970:181-1065(-)